MVNCVESDLGGFARGALLTLIQVAKTSIGNWAVGGFAMAIVRGELSYTGKLRTISGLVELIL